MRSNSAAKPVAGSVVTVPSIAGTNPQRVLEPADRVELASIVRDLYGSGKTFAFVGGGTELELGNPPRALDAAIRTTALDRVVDYSPEDQTITVEAGMRVASLDAVLAKHGQMLPLEVGDRREATVGGAIATNAFGALRHRYGSIKDQIVGIEIVRPDGVTAHGGGKVVKNVAGFDIPKLMVGSLGTLGAITAATLRVFPSPERTESALVFTSPDGAFLPACLDDPSLDPVAVVHYPAQRGVVLTFAGLPAAVEQQLAHLEALAGASGVTLERLGADGLERCAAAEAAVRVRGAWRWTATLPRAAGRGALPAVAEAVEVTYPTLGVTLASAGEDALLDALCAARGSSVVFRAMPQRFRGRIDAWGEPPPSFSIMRALKANFDPKNLCNPGRFVGGL
jgi:glycolate oxidase FAD binding subunit